MYFHLPGPCHALRASLSVTNPFCSCGVTCPHRVRGELKFDPGPLRLQGYAFPLSHSSSQHLLRSSWMSPTANVFRQGNSAGSISRDLSPELSFANVRLRPRESRTLQRTCSKSLADLGFTATAKALSTALTDALCSPGFLPSTHSLVPLARNRAWAEPSDLALPLVLWPWASPSSSVSLSYPFWGKWGMMLLLPHRVGLRIHGFL